MASDEHRSSKQYPELRHFDSPKEAQAALKEWQKEQMKKPRFWIVLLAYTAGVGLFLSIIIVSLGQWFRLPRIMFGGIVASVTGGSGMVVITWFWRRECRRYLREQLVACGVPICIKCGYDLRGQIEPRCPECGTPCDAELINQHNHAEE